MSFRFLLPLAAGLFLAACGDGDSNVSTGTPAPVANASPEGIYAGTATSRAAGATYNLVGGISPGGDVQLVNGDTFFQYSGRLTTTGTAASGTLQAFDATGLPVTTLSVQGTVTAGRQLAGTYTAANGDSGNITLTYQALYDTGYPLATLAGSYTYASPRNGGQSTATVTGTGAVSGTTEYGCTFAGQLAAINAARNLYTLRVNTANTTACGAARNSTLNGLAFYNPGGNGQAPTLAASATSAAAGYFAGYEKR